jgi:hypothetical protein
MTNARPPRRTLVGPSAAAAATLSLFVTAAVFPGSAEAAQDPAAPPPSPPPTVTTPPPPAATTTTAETTTTTVTATTPPGPMTTPVGVTQPQRTESAALPQERERTQFDDSFDLYLVPGVLNMPFGGEENVDYSERFDPGYQWGLGLGWFERSDDSRLAIGVGAFFDHAILNSERRQIDDITELSEHVFRVGMELRPGVVIGERLFLNLPIRGGYAARMTHSNVQDDTELDVSHGPMVGVAGGVDLAIYRGLYIGTAAGADFQFFRAGRDHDFYTVSWRALIGYRF